jgi:hypothetical protein
MLEFIAGLLMGGLLVGLLMGREEGEVTIYRRTFGEPDAGAADRVHLMREAATVDAIRRAGW